MGSVRGWSSRRDRDERGWLRGAPPPRWVRVLPVLLLAVVTGATLATADAHDLGFLLGAIPPLAVLSYGPWATAVLGGAVVVVLNVPATHVNRPGDTDLLTVAFIALLSVFVSFVRSHRDAQLDTERAIGEAVQRAVMPPLPRRVGRVACAGFSRAAQHGTLVGGDFLDVRGGPYGVRAVVGDVQGHGLAALTTVVALLGAFREAVLDQPDLGSVAARMDRRLEVDSSGVRHAELFATAVLLEFSTDARTVRLVACGHPPPVLLRGGHAREVGVAAGPPLGIGLAGAGPPKEVTVALGPRDRLLLASDGVWEARDASGAFYPLPERLAALARTAPAALPGAVWADLLRHRYEVRDDATMLVLTAAPPLG
ncbi:PP2C family protein-serine/threonine phosphatase [Streptomyces sp. TG1A-8]|uniref:PP2C family protein-serine/threonine phosphatase n=1 Tax=Streptomyces sp. TG1A-8 TaxID=3051385 RepID=UPI00265BD477|nr:PP2C family protein-serine/threonine phosphatase [Streptomyces sp. TG1A-8]MDO0929213.1 PP2C family protein-serine/threonine phosphatase [Streptomyces sp. TG1A-8]